MITAAEAPIVERRYSRPFALSTTSSQQEEPADSPTTFGSASDSTLCLYAYAAHMSEHATASPARMGRFIFVESEDPCHVSSTDGLVSHPLAQPASCSGDLASNWRTPFTPRSTITQETLDWDYAVSPPKRPSGTIKVTLSFAGRGKPLSFNPD